MLFKEYKVLDDIFLKLIYCFPFISLRVRSFGQIFKSVFDLFFSPKKMTVHGNQ